MEKAAPISARKSFQQTHWMLSGNFLDEMCSFRNSSTLDQQACIGKPMLCMRWVSFFIPSEFLNLRIGLIGTKGVKGPNRSSEINWAKQKYSVYCRRGWAGGNVSSFQGRKEGDLRLRFHFSHIWKKDNIKIGENHLLSGSSCDILQKMLCFLPLFA